jgi:hypothetical protein
MSNESEIAVQSALERYDAVGFDDLNEEEKVLVTVWAIEGEVNNGGFDQFFFNSAGDVAFYGPRALEAIGANKMAIIAEQANSIFGEGGPNKIWAERREVVLSFKDKFDSFLDSLDALFYEYPDDIAALIEKYVTANN